MYREKVYFSNDQRISTESVVTREIEPFPIFICNIDSDQPFLLFNIFFPVM
jgi:hypothetical protein